MNGALSLICVLLAAIAVIIYMILDELKQSKGQKNLTPKGLTTSTNADFGGAE